MLLVRSRHSGVPQYTRGIRWFIGFPWTWWNNERKRTRRKRDGIMERRGRTESGGKETKRGKRRKEEEVGDYRLWRRLVYGSADAHHLFERTCCSKCVYPPLPDAFALQSNIAAGTQLPPRRNPRFPRFLLTLRPPLHRLCFCFPSVAHAKYVFERYVIVRDEFSEPVETRAPITISLFGIRAERSRVYRLKQFLVYFAISRIGEIIEETSKPYK